MNEEISNNIPDSLYKEYFTPDYNLHPEFVHKHDNANSKQYLEMITKTVYDNLKMVAFSPSVQMQDMIGMTRIDITTGPHSNRTSQNVNTRSFYLIPTSFFYP